MVMIRAQGILEVSIRIVCVAMAAVSLYACSQTSQPAATSTGALNAPSQAAMEEVVISASRGQADAARGMSGAQGH
jgi:hypothetical protein